MTRALLCLGPGQYEIIEVEEATEEQIVLLIHSQTELDWVNEIMKQEEQDSELE
ncbi:hypothetical protein [Luteimonas sp. MC1750]|uniref:hypothetical protein n=1 Tax=Luteimonas sp. MC1750 TaxID=2799326 RepID=UPI0018F0A975|nr:hypothetical protein [Luteimonas sp. MC1750]MBJ6984024.1 hypothetical protein [Luteimonas sp. MC1750]QQO06836.1 hypothetical protein JGR68_05260 [Luteimonas sp. MC1750]